MSREVLFIFRLLTAVATATTSTEIINKTSTQNLRPEQVKTIFQLEIDYFIIVFFIILLAFFHFPT